MATMQDLRPDEVANLKGKFHPLYKGVLRVAMENGLRELRVKILQFPLPENGQLAVCEAFASFGKGEDERVFVEVGDCDDSNCGTMIRAHKVRMAATRAKGRALRDALGIGEALAEEIGSTDPEERPSRTKPGDPEVIPYRCENCGQDVPDDAVGPSRYRFKGHLYCPSCQGGMAEGMAAQGALACVDCGVIVPQKIAEASLQSKWGVCLCLHCGRARKAKEKEAVAA